MVSRIALINQEMCHNDTVTSPARILWFWKFWKFFTGRTKYPSHRFVGLQDWKNKNVNKNKQNRKKEKKKVLGMLNAMKLMKTKRQKYERYFSLTDDINQTWMIIAFWKKIRN